MSMKTNSLLSNRIYFFGVFLIYFCSSCKQNPETFAIHSPIYPTATNPVTFTLNKIEGDVVSVKLFEFVANVNSAGGLSSTTPETLLQSWTSPTFPVTFTKPSGYGSNKYVTYRFEVIGNDNTYNSSISFATSPYPVANAAAPVYVVGDIDRVLNSVFVPDADMAGNMNTFYKSVAANIDSSFHREDWVRRFRYSYNFFINPFSGTAGNFSAGTSHAYPSNDANLSFAQARIILHTADKRDFSDGRYVGTEYYNRGTILHETGHLLYGMADEYGGGSHWQNEKNPNNWASLALAQGAASGVGKTNADAVQMGSDSFWRLCNNDCMMLNTGRTIFPYDKPCQGRILYAILERSKGN
jgi:hypothetical protein